MLWIISLKKGVFWFLERKQKYLDTNWPMDKCGRFMPFMGTSWDATKVVVPSQMLPGEFPDESSE